MPLLSCIPKKQKKTKTVLLEKIILILCEGSIPMINAGVISFSNGFVFDRGWEYSVSSNYDGNDIFLKILVKNKIETLVKENDKIEDCVVCTNPTNETINCCNQSICLNCLREIKKTCEKSQDMEFCCPVCRRYLDDSLTEYKFNKNFLDKLSEAGENEYEKLRLIKNILK